MSNHTTTSGGTITTKRQCRFCDIRYPEHLTTHTMRQGGGTYRRGGRSYHTTICCSCATRYAAMPITYAMQQATRGLTISSARFACSRMGWHYKVPQDTWSPKGQEMNRRYDA